MLVISCVTSALLCLHSDQKGWHMVAWYYAIAWARKKDQIWDVQRSAKVFVRGCEKFVIALAYLFCPALPGSCLARFAYFLADVCRLRLSKMSQSTQIGRVDCQLIPSLVRRPHSKLSQSLRFESTDSYWFAIHYISCFQIRLLW